MIELRCANSLHAKYDPETETLEVKCRYCSHQLKQPVYHRWRLPELIEQVNRGEVTGVCAPTDPQFVHWRVTGR